ncbi:MAG: flagellin lysine-N-methylase [Oscillospiraceae bacterium]|nr:flagellin lysine-N-methylase [Oscillospiraceae bacterium]
MRSDAEAHCKTVKHLAPACFEAFACVAGNCPDSCCRAGWEIIPDAETLSRYQSLPGAAGDRVRAGIVPGAEPLLRQDVARVCVLLDPDGLCCVQRSFGHAALCRVCREYPRFHREFGGLTEHGISLSCPTAYGLAVSAPPAWREWEDDAPPVPNELDPEQYLRLRRGRALALSLLEREEQPPERRLLLLRRLATAIQTAPERRLRHDYALRLRRWTTLPRHKRQQTLAVDYAELARQFLKLEILSPDWEKALRRFAAKAEAGELSPAPVQGEACIRWLWYSLYKYWLDALDDGALLARVDRSLIMALLGAEMDLTLPGEGPFLRRLSREVEHCEENLSALLQLCRAEQGKLSRLLKIQKKTRRKSEKSIDKATLFR